MLRLLQVERGPYSYATLTSKKIEIVRVADQAVLEAELVTGLRPEDLINIDREWRRALSEPKSFLFESDASSTLLTGTF